MSSQSCRASPGRSSAGAAHLHLAVRVRERAELLGVRRSRQHDVGVPRRLGQEDVLHDEMLELRERVARVILVGVGHRGVLAHDVHARDLALVHRVHDLDDREAALRIERLAPEVLVPAADVELLDGLVVREVHRNQARVGRALHVVLAAQRMQAGSGPADLAGDQRERDQAARVVGAVRVLRDTHAPENDRRFRRRVDARNIAQHARFDTDDLRHRFGREVLDLRLERLEARDVLADVRGRRRASLR